MTTVLYHCLCDVVVPLRVPFNLPDEHVSCDNYTALGLYSIIEGTQRQCLQAVHADTQEAAGGVD